MVLTGAPQGIPEHLCLDLVWGLGCAQTMEIPGPRVQVPLFEGRL